MASYLIFVSRKEFVGIKPDLKARPLILIIKCVFFARGYGINNKPSFQVG